MLLKSPYSKRKINLATFFLAATFKPRIMGSHLSDIKQGNRCELERLYTCCDRSSFLHHESVHESIAQGLCQRTKRVETLWQYVQRWSTGGQAWNLTTGFSSFMRKYVCIHNTHKHTCTDIHTHKHMYRHTEISTHAQTCTHSQAHMDTHTDKSTDTHTHKHTYIDTQIKAHMHRYTHSQAHMCRHTHVHTQNHTHFCRYMT